MKSLLAGGNTGTGGGRREAAGFKSRGGGRCLCWMYAAEESCVPGRPTLERSTAGHWVQSVVCLCEIIWSQTHPIGRGACWEYCSYDFVVVLSGVLCCVVFKVLSLQEKSTHTSSETGDGGKGRAGTHTHNVFGVLFIIIIFLENNFTHGYKKISQKHFFMSSTFYVTSGKRGNVTFTWQNIKNFICKKIKIKKSDDFRVQVRKIKCSSCFMSQLLFVVFSVM